ncbi:sigma-E factor regulatory protein RseB domain-containing protein [Pseudonocardia saturnea]
MAVPRFSRRWLLVGAGAAALVGLPALPRPVGVVEDLPADALRDRVLAASIGPYVGYAESSGRLGLPRLPQLESAVALVTGETRIRAFVASPERFRVDELLPVGERSTYRVDGAEFGSNVFTWDFDADQLTAISGTAPLRLPRAADLLPPELARRLLRLAPGDPVATLPARRVAGRTAAGLRLTPADPDTTVGQVDVWADAGTGLPLRVEVAPRGGEPLLTTAFTEVDPRAPAEDDLLPQLPTGAGFVRADAGEIAGALRQLDAPPPPDRLTGRDRVPLTGTPGSELPGVGLYGTGIAGFALIPVSREIADRAVDGAALAGGTGIAVDRGRAVRLSSPLLSLAVLARGRRGTLLIGTVAADLLEQALLELPDRRRP